MATPITVSCLLVMGCSNPTRCNLAEQLLVKAGFECCPMTEGAGSCMKTFVREHQEGPANALIDETCLALEEAIPAEVHDWKAFIQVSGSDTAWATLQAGKPTLRGTHSLPHRVPKRWMGPDRC